MLTDRKIIDILQISWFGVAHLKQMLKTSLATLMLLASSDGAIAQTLTYHNKRYGFAIQYPSTFKLGEPPPNGDGIPFISPIGGSFRAAAIPNALEDGAESLFQAEINYIKKAGGTVTYTPRLRNGYVVSGFVGDQIRYVKVIFADYKGHSLTWSQRLTSNTIIVEFYAEYPTKQKAEFDRIVSLMARTLRPGRAMQ
jgi:hypothetical protein